MEYARNKITRKRIGVYVMSGRYIVHTNSNILNLSKEEFDDMYELDKLEYHYPNYPNPTLMEFES